MKKLSKKTQTKKVPFSKLSPDKKKVAIARDVLEQIRIGRYISKSGSYISNLIMKNGDDRYKIFHKDIKSNFGQIKKCEVCAMGACLMSITKFENKLTFDDIGGSMKELKNSKTQELFQSIFSPEQLLLMERAFEGDTGGTTVGVHIFGLFEEDFQKKIRKCQRFYDKFSNQKKYTTSEERQKQNGLNQENRLIAIMRNLIKNKGTFIP